MVWKFSDIKILIEGLMIAVFCLLLLTICMSMPSNYSLNYGVYPESNDLVLQQGTSYTLNVYYTLDNKDALPFFFSTIAPEGISVKVIPKVESYTNFNIPLYIAVGNITPGDYQVFLVTKVLYGGMVNEKSITINVKVVPKEMVVFQTSQYTNELPNLVLVEISTRNLLLGIKDKQTILFKFKNTGSASTFSINPIIDSSDKNKVHISFSESYFFLRKGESRNILMFVEVDENYAILFTPIYLYAKEQSTSNQLDLGQINITLKTQDILISQNIETNTLEIINIGTDIVALDINTNKRNFSMYLMPNQTYFLQADNAEKDVNIYLNGSLYKQIEFANVNTDASKEDNNKSKLTLSTNLTGLFSLGSSSTVWIIIGLFLFLIILVVYKLFFSKNAVFGKTIYVKDLKLNNN